MAPISRLIAAAVVTAAFGAPAAQADSISYIKDGDVWLTTPDGARQHRVTSDGGYGYASQADDGTIIALHGRRIRKLERATGAVQADFATPVSDTPAGSSSTFYGPIDPVVSPDGKRIAYGWRAQFDEYDPYCGYQGGCKIGKLIVGTGYSWSDRLTGWDEPGFKQHSGWQWPAWYDNDHVVISNPAEYLNDEVWVDTVGDDQYGQEWFDYNGSGGYSLDAEVDRQQDAVVTVGRGGGSYDKYLDVYTVDGPPPSATHLCHRAETEANRTASSPSWSPDGTRLAYDDGTALYVVGPIERQGCDFHASLPVAKLLDGATEPDWGPADVPADPPPAGDAGKPAAGGVAGAGAGGGSAKGAAGVPGTTGAADGSGLAASVTPAKLSRALKRGIAVRVEIPAAGRLSLSALLGRRTVAVVPARTVAAGGARVTLRFTKAGRRALKRSRSARLSIRVTFTPKGGTPQTTTVPVALRG